MRGHLSETYLVAIGSNMGHARHGSPRQVVMAAAEALDHHELEMVAFSPIIDSAPLGPSRRTYANAAAVVASDLQPGAMLQRLQTIESGFARRRMGRPWQARTLDLDIVLWSGGIFAASDLLIPHPRFRSRAFVLGPAVQIAPGWRDPVSGLTLRQLHSRLTSPRPLA